MDNRIKIGSVALYAQVSTTDMGQDVDLQLDALREFARKRGWATVEFIDQGVSGAKMKRPALNELLKAVKSRQVDAVLVWKLDRLGRSLSHLLQLLQEFQALDVAFISLRENLDMTTPTGRLMTHLIGAFAEFEREIIRERVKAGIETARKKGKRIGRNATASISRRLIIELYQDPEKQLSLREIAKKAKTSLGTVQRIIDGYRIGRIDRDGFDSSPLIPEAFSSGK